MLTFIKDNKGQARHWDKAMYKSIEKNLIRAYDCPHTLETIIPSTLISPSVYTIGPREKFGLNERKLSRNYIIPLRC